MTGRGRRAIHSPERPSSRGGRGAEKEGATWGNHGFPHAGVPPRLIGSWSEDRHRRAVLLVVLGSGGRARRASGGRSRGSGTRGSPRDGQRPAGAVHAGPPPARRSPREPARQRHPRGPVGDRARERLASQHRPQPAVVLPGQARARAGAVRPPASPRADDACDLRCGARAGAGADGRDPPRLRRSRLDAPRHARLGVPDGSHRSADRGLGAGAGLGRPLVGRAVGGRPQRRPDPRTGGPGRSRAHRRLRRPPRAAQRAPGPPARLAGAPPPHRSPPRRRRCRPARRTAAAHPARRLRRRDRGRRLPLPGRAHGPPRSPPRHCLPRRSAARASEWC